MGLLGGGAGLVIGLIACIITSIIGIIGGLVLIVNSLNYVHYDEYGLAYSTITKQVGDTVYENGRYLLGVGHYFIKFPKTHRTITFWNGTLGYGEGLNSRTKEGLPLWIECAFQYRIRKNNVVPVFKQFADAYETVLYKLGREVLRDTASRFNATQYFNERRLITDTMSDELKERLASIGITVELFQFHDFSLPSRYENTLERKEMVVQEILKAELEREQKSITALTDVMVAEKKAQVEITQAEAQARSQVMEAGARANGTKLNEEVQSISYREMSEKLGFNTTQLLSYLWIKAIKDQDPSKLVLNFDEPEQLRP